MRYIPHTEADVARLLEACGKKGIEELFASIPEQVRLKRPLAVGEPMDEAALDGHLGALAVKNLAQGPGGCALSFLGAGAIGHAVPAAVDALLSRAEWYTVYTPYQPEISQGTLQSIFEYQTVVAEILGLDVANASMYDGASACAEAVLMARRATGKRVAVISRGVHPEYVQTTRTYVAHMDGEGFQSILEVPFTGCGETDDVGLQSAIAKAGADLACVVVQTPNFYGVIEDLAPIAAQVHQAGGLLVAVSTEPLAFALLEAPGQLGADIACAEGLGLAGATSFGGPGVGLFAVKKDLQRQIPGRLVGETVDLDGRRGYVLTLATREQHIRRERATSNICTNHGLMSLAFTIHLSLLGKQGFADLARLNAAKAAYARDVLTKLPGFAARFTGAIFNELALKVPGGDAARLCETLATKGVLPGVALGRFDASLADTLLVSVNETHRKQDIDALAQALEEVTR
ncbi:MAG TPA: aminomethyl-transferring glycine dehydrogenase subunit GcvPA [Polyangia bacterium]|jgi:glycine dehydrogenase subunit 1